jgi:hypothetical protein
MKDPKCGNFRRRQSGVATLPCISGNGLVRSAGENVPPRSAVGLRGASQGAHGEPQGKVVINSVNRDQRKGGCHAGAKRHAARWGYCPITPLLPVAQPEDSNPLKALLNVVRTELGNPVEPRSVGDGIQAVRREDGLAGVGWWSKRRPACNGPDRAARMPICLCWSGFRSRGIADSGRRV